MKLNQILNEAKEDILDSEGMFDSKKFFEVLKKHGIVIKTEKKRAAWAFEFNGDEKAFKQTLLKVMKEYGLMKQNSKWFPGDPGQDGDEAYYIYMDDVSGGDMNVNMAFDFNNKLLYIT